MQQQKIFSGRVAIVTGAASGIGRASAHAFARAGAAVLAVDIDVTAGESVCAAIRDAGGDAHFFEANVAVSRDVEAMVAESIRQFGRLDFAHNNAGIEGRVQPLTAMSDEEFDRIIAVNVRSTWLCMKHEIPHMVAAGGGAIVNAASYVALAGAQGLAAYCASKHAVSGLTKSAALEFGAQGVRVNALCPGVILTPMIDRIVAGNDAAKAAMISPMGRSGNAEEVADVAVWLCSDAARFINGAQVPVDGGAICQ